MKRQTVIIILVLIFLLGISQCSRREQGKGPNDVIYVISSENIAEEFEQVIDTTFRYCIRTPRPQRFFKLQWSGLESFSSLALFKNVIIIADLDEGGLPLKIAKGVLGEEKVKLADQDSTFLFFISDKWAENQSLLLIAGRDTEKMKQNILEQQGWIYQKFNKRLEADIYENMYRRNEEKEITRSLWKKYGWTIRVPRDYIVLQPEIPRQNFVWLGVNYPYRWFSVSWARGVKTEWLMPNGLYEKRKQIGEFYGDHETNSKFLGHRYGTLGPWKDVLIMTGIWNHTEDAKGGPFETFAFYDSKTDMTYVIDMLIFYPGKDKTFYYKQMEVMARTFTTSYIEGLYTDDYFD